MAEAEESARAEEPERLVSRVLIAYSAQCTKCEDRFERPQTARVHTIVSGHEVVEKRKSVVLVRE